MMLLLCYRVISFAYIRHCILRKGCVLCRYTIDRLRRYEESVWEPMMGSIIKVMDGYFFEVMLEETLVQLREEDAARDILHQKYIAARDAWELSMLSERRRFEFREAWAHSQAEKVRTGKIEVNRLSELLQDKLSVETSISY
jgi:hypothetical protein